MDVVTSGIATVGDIMSGFWAFASSNIIIMIPLTLAVVGMGIALFMSIKSRLSGRRKKGKRRA